MHSVQFCPRGRARKSIPSNMQQVAERSRSKYSTIERGAFAIVWAVQKVPGYVGGSQVKLITDHQLLQWLMSIHDVWPAGHIFYNRSILKSSASQEKLMSLRTFYLDLLIKIAKKRNSVIYVPSPLKYPGKTPQKIKIVSSIILN